MQTKIINNQRGLSLVELIVYISLAAMMLLSIAMLSSKILEYRARQEIISEVELQGTQIMQQITQAIRNAQAVNSPSLGTSADSLSLNVDDGAKSPTIIDLSGGSIRITEGAGQAQELNNSLAPAVNLIFDNLSRSGSTAIIKIQFTLANQNIGERAKLNYSKTFYGSANLNNYQ